MNLYALIMLLVVEADDVDEATASVEDVLMNEPWIKDYDITLVRTLPLMRRDDDG